MNAPPESTGAETRFAVDDALPWGVVSIGASAGTGKTFTLAALATRYVAEAGVPIGQLLVVTFTRAATAELRSRIRQRFQQTLRALTMGVSPDEDDPLLKHLLQGDRDLRAERLRLALADFDAATIGTIHGFAQQVLSSLGSASHGGVAADIETDTRSLVHEVTTDVLVAHAAASELKAPGDTEEPITAGDLINASLTVLNNPDILVVPDPATDGRAGFQAQLVREIVDEVERRRRKADVTGYDGLLTGVRDALDGPDGHRVVTELRTQFHVALVDEFQDTDPVQWSIFRQVFADAGSQEGRALVMVGDPKQAIYSFRGADIDTYLRARRSAGMRRTLSENHRSDGAMVQAVNQLFLGADFGRGEIPFQRAVAAEPEPRLAVDGGAIPALQLRTIAEDDPSVQNAGGKALVTDYRRVVAADLADQVVEMVARGEITTLAASSPADDGERHEADKKAAAVRPQDIAVLVPAWGEVPFIRQALAARGIPSVVSRAGNVLQSEAANHWQWLLHGLARPSDVMRARMVALSWFNEATVETLWSWDDRELSVLQQQLAGWASSLETGGVVALRHRVWSDSRLVERMLVLPDGDRIMTDLDHIAEVLTATVGGTAIGAVGLLALFNSLALQAPDDSGTNDLLARRLESDDNAVQIMTVHVSKGLEFPIVLLPSLWQAKNHARTDTRFTDGGQRIYDVATKHNWIGEGGQTSANRVNLAKKEMIEEQMRLAYVAFTRARHLTVAWWTPYRSGNAPLSRLLNSRTNVGLVGEDLTAIKAPSSVKVRAQVDERVRLLTAPANGTIAHHRVDERVLSARQTLDYGDASPPPLSVAPLTRKFDRDWRRWSFTSLTAGSWERLHDIAPGDEDAAASSGANDEPIVEPLTDQMRAAATMVAEEPTTGPGLPLGELMAGAAFGTLVHDVLEHVDFASPTLVKDLQRELAGRDAVVDVETLATGLVAAASTPMGPLFDGRALRDFSAEDVADEMAFDIALGRCSGTRIGQLLAQYSADDPMLSGPLRPWVDRLVGGELDAAMAGWMTGSIDGVFRVAGGDGEGGGEAAPDRFVVVDYKTNLLGDRYRLPTIADYAPLRLAEAMAHHHYPLQGLLYSAGLHRYLRLRLADYNPAVHLGGMAYLFVRGMVGVTTPMVNGDPHGVFGWRPDAGLVVALSDLLDGQVA